MGGNSVGWGHQWRRVSIAALLAAIALLAPAGSGWAKPASIIVDAASGAVLYESNSRGQNYPASLTKMMTLYLLFESLEAEKFTLDQNLTASAHAAKQPATDLGLKTGQTVTVETAIKALIIHSANDVAVVVAEAIAGTESKFAKLMTKKARSLGMKDTTFRNASGLPDAGQVTTARDMAILARALITRFPQYYGYFDDQRFTYGGRTYTSHNRVLQYVPEADGLKTGYIRASGFNLASSAIRDNKRIVAVVLGGKTARARDLHMVQLLERGFQLLKVPKQAVTAAALPAAPETEPEPEPEVVASVPLPPRKPELGDIEVDVIAAKIETAAATSESTGGGWGIQVGAFAKHAPAEKAAIAARAAAASLVSGARVVVDATNRGSGKLYRARLVGLSQERAQAACKALEAVDIPCLAFQTDVNLAQRPGS